MFWSALIIEQIEKIIQKDIFAIRIKLYARPVVLHVVPHGL